MFFIDPSSHDIGRSHSSSPASFTPSVRWGIGIDADDFRLSPTASSDRFTFHLLRSNSSLINGYWELRSAIFCEEQHLFEATDRDELDAEAYPITAIHHGSSHCGQVVGVVRIVEQQPRIWYGGRLGVQREFRRHNQIGKGLIWKAVPDESLSQAVTEAASILANGPTRAFVATRCALDRSRSQSLHDQLDLEAVMQSDLLQSDDFFEGTRAFIEKRKPAFKGK